MNSPKSSSPSPQFIYGDRFNVDGRQSIAKLFESKPPFIEAIHLGKKVELSLIVRKCGQGGLGDPPRATAALGALP
jgi:hypothetical protein